MRWLIIALMLNNLTTFAADLIPATYTNANWRYVHRPPTWAELRARTIHATFDTAASPSLASVQAAHDSCPSNQTVMLTSSDGLPFIWAGRLVIREDGAALIGETNQQVVIRNTGTAEDSMIAISSGNHSQLLTTSTAYGVWTNDMAKISKGSTNINMKTAPSEWAVGDIIQFDYLEGDAAGLVESDGNTQACTWCSRSDGDRPINDQVQVLAIANNTNVTFWPPLSFDLNIEQTPEGIEHKGIVRNAYVAGLTFTNVGSSRDIVLLEGAWQCALIDCKLYICDTRGVWWYGGGENSLIGCTIKYGEGADWGIGYTSSKGYAISFSLQSARPLVENCDISNVSFGFAFEGGGQCGVIGYNYITNVMTDAPDATKESAGNHGSHARSILFEGNIFKAKILHDHYFGSSERIVTFRTAVSSVYTQNGTPVTQYCILYDAWTNQVYHLVVACRFGIAGQENQFDVLNAGSVNQGTTNKAIRRLGSLNANHTTRSEYDPTVTNTLHWAINWQSATNNGTNASGIVYHADVSDTNPPVSLYLTSKPSWMANRPWPPVDPYTSTNPLPTDIQAGWRHYFGTNEIASEGGGGGDLTFERGAPRLRGLKL